MTVVLHSGAKSRSPNRLSTSSVVDTKFHVLRTQRSFLEICSRLRGCALHHLTVKHCRVAARVQTQLSTRGLCLLPKYTRHPASAMPERGNGTSSSFRARSQSQDILLQGILLRSEQRYQLSVSLDSISVKPMWRDWTSSVDYARVSDDTFG